MQIRLNGIALGSTSAWTVGGLTDAANTFHAYAQYFDGSGWSLGAPVDAGSTQADTWLNDVVAFPDGPSGSPQAWAVGYAGPASTFLRPKAIVEHWVGPDPTSPWRLTALPTSDGTYTDLISAASVGSGRAWAVGISRQGVTDRALIERFDGTTWHQAAPAPLPASTVSSGLTDVTAAGPKDVWAAGWRNGGAGYETLVEHYDGTSWSRVGSPSPGAAESVLLGVAADAEGAWAVGYRNDGTRTAPLVERFDGSRWRVVAAPQAVGLADVLRSVTISPTGRVWAAGFTLDAGAGAFHPLVVTADPNVTPISWTATPTASQNGTTIGRELNEIAAEPSGDQLWSVGTSGDALIETICPAGGAAPERVGSASPSSATAPRAYAPSVAASVVASKRSNHPKKTLTIAADVGPSAFPGEPSAVRTNGLAVGDFAGPSGPGKDGYPDVEIGRFADAGMELWVNQQDGAWEQVDAGTFPEADRYYCAFGDVGSESSTAPDGLPDLFCTIGAAKGTGLKGNELWIQRPDGSFVRSTIQPAVTDVFGRGRVAAMFDPRDPGSGGSAPSLFVGNQLGRGDGVPTPSRLYLNRNGTLVDTPAVGLDLETGASCVQPVDVDRDHRVDLLVCTNVFRLALFHNDGTGPDGIPRFTEVTARAGIAQGGVRFGLLRDLNGDRCPDLVEVFGQRLDVLAQGAGRSGSCLGTFTRVWSRALTNGRWAAAGDVNGDHRPDLYLLQGGSDPDLMLLNDGKGRSFSSIPVPQATAGQGDIVLGMRNRATGYTDFVVANGDHAQGPIQLIRFSPNPAPSPIRITDGPPDETSSTKATFRFDSSVGAGTVCSLDGSDPAACSSGVTYRDLEAGRHRFAVWAVDASGAPLAEDADAFRVLI
jgi:hypothetical protein